jgi:succinate dehydrogenase flavin-adding protein (antitoxin of CptAB toxin-antitoxin module)
MRTAKVTWQLGVRGLRETERIFSLCWRQLERLTPRKKLSKTEFICFKEILDCSLKQMKKLLQ